jgi:class 3 adenylate cyclase/tetratricopeptide (TPR) repeat protein
MTSQVAAFLKPIGLEHLAELFAENEVDLATLLVLTDDDLKELGLPFGPRKKLLKAIADDGAKPVVPIDPEGERRQLTVLFCDMVGFTELAYRIDPELLKSIVQQYEDACTACIKRFGGYVYTMLGDGIVAFFGYPRAHEDEAERAIRAALDILETMAEFEFPEIGRLQVRIGIATGMVVVASGERNAVGETMNLASRLQGVARPGGIAISDRVYRLAGGGFDYEDLGEHELRGIANRMRVYGVRGVSSIISRFDAATQVGLTALVGREAEIQTLVDRWQGVRTGNVGHAVTMLGEPGIGKSRIIRAFRERLDGQGGRPLLFQCSQFHINSAFYPIIVALERLLGLNREMPVDARLDRIDAIVGRQFGLPVADVRFISALLSLPIDRYPPLAISARLVKAETIRVLVDLIAAMAREQHSLMLFEDAHWADPSTIEVLTRIVENLGDIPLLFILTHRHEFASPWSHHANVTALNLNKLTAAQSRSLIAGLAGDAALPAALITQIVAKTDGVPLFVEELTRTIIESGQLDIEGGRYVYAGNIGEVTIPDTLRDSLTARLDRVASIKKVAQIGSAIGREFSFELVAALGLMPHDDLVEALDQLTASGLASAHGAIPHAVYTFKHALVQDTAYDSLLKSQRKPLHSQIAQAIAARWPETLDNAPELLAHHFTAAGLAKDAIPLWRRAGETAMKRFALIEAVTHLQLGMKLLETQPETQGRAFAELGFRTMLGPAAVAQRGWGHGDVSSTLIPAWELAESLDHAESFLPILNSLWVHFLCRDQLQDSLRWAEKMLELGSQRSDDSLLVAGHRAASASYFWLGRFADAQRHGEKVHAIYDEARHWHIAQLTNTDPLTGEGIYRSQYLWMLGYPDSAVAATLANEAHARKRNHPFDLAFALTLGAQAFDFRAEPAELLRRTEEAARVGREHGVALLWEVMADISRGLALARGGELAESIDALDQAIARLAATGHRVWLAYLHAVRAEAMALTGDLEGADAMLDQSLQRIETGEERAHYAEVLRLKGWVLMLMGKPDLAEARLRVAIAVAQGQNARSWELRAATTLAELLAARGDAAAAHDLLAPLHDGFDEGLDTHDLRAAGALLDQLRPAADAVARKLVKA